MTVFPIWLYLITMDTGDSDLHDRSTLEDAAKVRIVSGVPPTTLLRLVAYRASEYEELHTMEQSLHGLVLLDGVTGRARRPTRATAVFQDGWRHRARWKAGKRPPTWQIYPPSDPYTDRRCTALEHLLEVLAAGT